jgi:hypothetical protein
MLTVAQNIGDVLEEKQFKSASYALEWHFAGIPQDQLIATSRQFPGHMRADVQTAVDRLFSASPIRFFGIHERHRYETLTIAPVALRRPCKRHCTGAISRRRYRRERTGEMPS